MESWAGDIARQTAPNLMSQFPEHMSEWYLIPPYTVSLLSAWLWQGRRTPVEVNQNVGNNCEDKMGGPTAG